MKVAEMSDLEAIHAFSIRALQPPPFVMLDVIYILSEVDDLNDQMMRSLMMVEPYTLKGTRVLITGHDPGDPALREEDSFDQTVVPVMGGARLASTLVRSGVHAEKVYGAFVGYADSVTMYNTYTELLSITRFVKEERFKTMGIFCPDVHATRTAITMISVLKEIGVDHQILFWIIQASTGGWDRRMSHSGGVEHPSGYAVSTKELEKFFGSHRYHNLVSLEEAFTYFDQRDKLANQLANEMW